MFKRALSLGIAALLLTGCAAMEWQHPYKDGAALNQDEYDCAMRANAMYPPLMEYRAGWTEEDRLGMRTRPRPAAAQFDRNADMRDEAEIKCMRNLGWR